MLQKFTVTDTIRSSTNSRPLTLKIPKPN